jgi:phenylpropionate dioxygenase-like ring-hydroxylating dioxygenase large terminal subunit
MSVTADWALPKNQAPDRTNELDTAGEARVYRSLRHFWHPVIRADQVADAPRRVTLCGHQLVVVRLDGECCVFNDLCAHRGTALSLGKVVAGADGDELRCPYHGWQYDHDGRCTLAPQRPDLAGRLRARIKRYNAMERYGLVWVCLEDEPRFPLPDFPQWDDPSYDKIFMPDTTWKCSAPRRTENYTDLAHFAIVHDGYLGDADHPEVVQHRVWSEPERGVLHLDLEEPMYEPPESASAKTLEHESELLNVAKTHHVFMPLTVLLDADTNGQHYCLFFHPSPVGPKETRNFTIGARNYGSKVTLHEAMVEFNTIIYEQDRPIVESQRPEELPEDLTAEMHLQGVDTFSLNYRKWLVELAAELTGAEDGREPTP